MFVAFFLLLFIESFHLLEKILGPTLFLIFQCNPWSFLYLIVRYLYKMNDLKKPICIFTKSLAAF